MCDMAFLPAELVKVAGNEIFPRPPTPLPVSWAFHALVDSMLCLYLQA